jgi:adenine/guanine phosphoribosyltransferase-like PRPP-binding protein
MRSRDTNTPDAELLGLQALAWTLGEQARAERLIATTGLYPDDLRARAGEPAVLAAVLAYLEAYEPDLIACSQALGVTPPALVAAHQMLESR